MHVTKALALLLVLGSACIATSHGKENPMVEITTSKGSIVLELYPDQAPVTVSNFLAYVDSGFYDGTVFHRVIRDFMIQGGGFDQEMTRKETLAPIANEAANGLRNERGTIAMARTMVPNSATSQFFINTADNRSLDYRDDTPQGIGYCVFGRVTKGADIVDSIQSVRTGVSAGMRDVPQEAVIITSIKRLEQQTEATAAE